MAKARPKVHPSKRNDWFFNTNETNRKDAFDQMITHSAIALYGYRRGAGERKLQRPRNGDRVFMFVNKRGIIAVGKFTDDIVRSSQGIFREPAPDEFRRRVEWSCYVNPERGVSCSIVAGWGYRLPVRCTVGRIHHASIGDRIERAIGLRGDDRL